MDLKKFPVKSENGNEYLIEVRNSYFSNVVYEVRIYEQYVNWFGMKRKRFLNEHFMGSARSYSITDFDYDLVKMAKYAVARLEGEWEAEERLKQKKLEAEQKFNDWNGDC